MTTITTRAGKGAELTYQELDDNFTNLNTDKLELTGGTLDGNITFATVDQGIIFADATSITSADGLGKTYNISAETTTGGANLSLSDGTITDDVTLAEGTGITVTRTDANVITIATTVVDTNTTYAISAETATGGANLRLTGTDASTDDVAIVGSGATTVSRTDANTITIASTDTNTTYTAGSGLSLDGTVFSHADTSSVANVTATSRAYVSGITFDEFGHVQAVTTGTETVVDTNTTYSISAETATGGANLRLTGSDTVTDDVKLAEGTGITVTRTDDSTITVATTALLNVAEDTTPQLGGNLDAMGFSISNVADIATDRVSLDSAATLTPALAEITWFGDDSTAAVGLADGVTGLVFQDAMIRIKASGAITKGQVVMFAGVQGENVRGAVCDFDSVGFRPEFVIGIAANTMADTEEGYVITQGRVKDIDTNAFTVGDILYANPTVDGGLTVTEPSAPNAKVELASVLKKNTTEGILQVRVRINPRLEDLTDVETAAPSDNDFLRYESDTGVWNHEPLDISYDTSPTLGGNLNVATHNFGNVGSYSGTGTIEVNTGDHTLNAWSSTTGLMLHSGNARFGRGFATAHFQPGNMYFDKSVGRLYATASSGTHSGGGSADGATRTTIDTLHNSAFEFSLTDNRTIRFINRNAGRTQNVTSNGITINTAGTYLGYEFWFTQDATGDRTVTWRTITPTGSTELTPTITELGSLGTDANQLTYARVWVKYGTSGNATDIRVIYETF